MSLSDYLRFLVTVDRAPSPVSTPSGNAEYEAGLLSYTKDITENYATNCVTAASACVVATPLFARYAATTTVGATIGSAALLLSSGYLYLMASVLRKVEHREHIYVRFPLVPVLNYTIYGTRPYGAPGGLQPWLKPGIKWGRY